MRLYVGIIILLVAVIALAVGLTAKPLEPPLLIDEPDQTGVMPAQLTMPEVMMCRPVLIGPAPSRQIVRT